MGHRRHRSRMNYAVLRTAPAFLSHVLHHDVHWTRLSNLVIRCERKKRSFPLCCGVAPSLLPAPFVQCWCAVWDGGPCEKNAHFRHSRQVPDDNIDLGGRGAAARHTPTHHNEERFFRSHRNRISTKWCPCFAGKGDAGHRRAIFSPSFLGLSVLVCFGILFRVVQDMGSEG